MHFTVKLLNTKVKGKNPESSQAERETLHGGKKVQNAKRHLFRNYVH